MRANGPQTGGVLLELRLYLTLGIGHLVVLIALNGILDGVADGVGQSEGVVGLHLTGTHLDSHLVLGNRTSLVAHLVHGEFHEVVVGLGFLCVVSQLVQVLFYQLSGLGIVF